MKNAPRLPVTDGRLAAIWPAWNALPQEFDATERDSILTGRNLDFGDYRQHYNCLAKRFKKLLPLNEADYHETLKVAAEWWRLMCATRSCIKQNEGEIKRQLCYQSFDKGLVGFTAAYRMHKEFAAMRPDLHGGDKCPTVTDLAFVRSRYEAYGRARRDAVEILSALIFTKTLTTERDLPFKKRTHTPPHSRFPRHLFVARLHAFKKCSERFLAHFMAQDFFQLTATERRAFCDEYDRPSVGREDYGYLRLWAWLAENAPVFNCCTAGWPEIFNVVKARFKTGAPTGCRSHPTDYEHLKILWRDFAVKHSLSDPPRISPPIGPPRKDRRAIPPDLLTPLPYFAFLK